MPGSSRLTFHNAAIYSIRIQGSLDQHWSDYISGATIRVKSQPDGSSVSVVTGEFQDQAALAGALNLLYNLGMPLLSVECISFERNQPVGLVTSDTLADGGS